MSAVSIQMKKELEQEQKGEEVLFRGQQEGERILYIVYPHWTRRVMDFITGVLAGVACYTIVFRILGLSMPIADPLYFSTFAIIVSLIVFMVTYGWLSLKTNLARGYLTDRRFMRIELLFPYFIGRRSLFWNEVGKVKGYESNLFLRMINVGRIGLDPFVVSGAAIEIKYVHYFEDLANYIDKILYIYKNKPHELIDLRPFVAKPAGKRY